LTGVKLPCDLPVLKSLTLRAESDSPLKAIAFFRTSLEEPSSFPSLSTICFFTQIVWPHAIDGYPLTTIRELGWRLLDSTLSQEPKFPKLCDVKIQERAVDKAPESGRVDIESTIERAKEISSIEYDLPGVSARASASACEEEEMKRDVWWDYENPGMVIERRVRWKGGA
jgi:hypothetical protein